MSGAVAQEYKVSPEGTIYFAALKGRDQKGKFSIRLRPSNPYSSGKFCGLAMPFVVNAILENVFFS